MFGDWIVVAATDGTGDRVLVPVLDTSIGVRYGSAYRSTTTRANADGGSLSEDGVLDTARRFESRANPSAKAKQTGTRGGEARLTPLNELRSGFGPQCGLNEEDYLDDNELDDAEDAELDLLLDTESIDIHVKSHRAYLRRRGIEVTVLGDGTRAQLTHRVDVALSQTMFEQGAQIVRQLVALHAGNGAAAKKTAGGAHEKAYETIEVHIVAPEQYTSYLFKGGPALFSTMDLKQVTGGVQGALAVAEPESACVPLTNAPALHGRVALVMRGACMFVEKLRHLQSAGAIAAIVVGTYFISTHTHTHIHAQMYK